METHQQFLREIKGFRLSSLVSIVLTFLTFALTIVLVVLVSMITSDVDTLKISHSGCNDYNDCTVDYSKEPAGCIHYPKEEGTLCSSSCHDQSSESLFCQNELLSSGISKATCSSYSLNSCKGFCLSNNDCGTISTVVGNLIGNCFATTCYYTLDPTGGTTIEGNEVPDLVCDAQKQIYHSTCRSFLNHSDLVVKSDCIVSDVQCETVISDLGAVQVPICYYYYGCSVQQYIPEILVSRNIERKTRDNAVVPDKAIKPTKYVKAQTPIQKLQKEMGNMQRETNSKQENNLETDVKMPLYKLTPHTYKPKNKRKKNYPTSIKMNKLDKTTIQQNIEKPLHEKETLIGKVENLAIKL